MKANRITRTIQILTALQAGRSYAVSNLSKIFGISRRTIFRDFKELKAIGVRFHYDSKTAGYIIEPGFFLPPVDLNTPEALSLLLLAHEAHKLIQLPFRNSALLGTLKIENNLPAKIKEYCYRALRYIFIKPVLQPRIEHLDKIFFQLIEAILRKRNVKIHYYSPCERKSIFMALSPYHLMFSNSTWYVLGKPYNSRKVHTFKLNRIKAVDILDKCFAEDKEFDIHEYLGIAWSMIREGKIYNVKLRFLPEVAYDVAEVQWHDTQKVTFEDDGSAIIEFRVDGLSEIIWWILSYGDKVEVLAPRVLRQKIIEITRKVSQPTPQQSPCQMK